MKTERKISLTHRFLRNIKVYFLSILALTFILIFTKDSRGLILVLFVGGTISFLSGTIFNLLYFIPIRSVEIRLLLPGVLTIATSSVIWWESKPDFIYFGLLGFINLGLGTWSYFEIKQQVKV